MIKRFWVLLVVTIGLLFVAVSPLLAEQYALSAMKTHQCFINDDEPKPLIHCDDEKMARSLQGYFDASIFAAIILPLFGVPAVTVAVVTTITGLTIITGKNRKKKEVLH